MPIVIYEDVFVFVGVATPKLASVMGLVVKDTTLDTSAAVESTALGTTPT